MNIETRLTNVENMLLALINKINIDKTYQGYDNDAFRQTDSNQGDDISQNAADIDFIAMETGVDLEE